MKSIRVILTGVLAALFILPVSAPAEDIDIYSGLGTTGNVPNVLIILDNAASFDAATPGCSYADGSGAASMSGKVAGIEQCALYNTVKGLPVKADGSALINLGFMVYNTTGIAAAFPSAGCVSSNDGGCLLVPLTGMTEAGKTSVLNWIKSWDTNTIKANNQGNAMAMQEAWAYYAGSTGASGRSYSGIKPAAGCQKNFVVYIGNAYRNNTTPGDNGSPSSKLSAAGNTDTSIITIPSGTYGLPMAYNSCGSYTMPNHTDTSGLYADEWARFMAKADLYTAADQPQGTQSIVTYTIGALGPTCDAQYPALLESMADAGNGKYFPTDADNADSIAQALLKIFNEVQAVNSVFSSSSLPVSVNAQGTYLNQIYMGMFRPDPGALPRWVGNLKQFKFIIDPTTGSLQLGDSIGEQAISSAGTGFISSNAISYWTCSRSDNPYLSGTNPITGLANVNATQLATLTSQGQICASDPVEGFWKNFSSMRNSAGKGFDMADGELVEKGAVAQRIRMDNLTDDYAANPRTPRKLYTYCPSGASCQTALTHGDNAFATDNTSITAGMLGTDITANISTLTRSGTVVTVTTSGNHGFSTNDSIKIANAAQSEYNGTFMIEKISDTQFKWTYGSAGNPNPVYPTTPVNPATNFTVQKAGTAIAVSLSRSNDTVTATASAAHGFANGSTVVIADAMQSAYNGSFVITTTADPAKFTFTVREQPPTVAGSGATTCTASYTTTSNKTATATVNAWNAALPGIQRAYGSTTVTVNTGTNLSTGSDKTTAGNAVTLTNCVDQYGVAVPAYNISTTIGSVSGNSFTFTTTVGPKTPADIAAGKTSISASPVTASHNITSLVRTDTTGTAATVTATVTAHGYADNDIVSIGYTGTAPSSQTGYLGNYTISNTTANTFDYTIATTPVSPASSATGATLTATRSTGFVASDRSALINWVRGEDNRNDETGPGGGVTIRPSVHGDVLHSRPVVINYGGAAISITGTSDSGSTRTATASATDVAKIGATSARQTIKFPTGNICTATVASATTFTYPTSNCGNSGAQSVITGTSNVVVYYGDNGGVFHAVNGNQTNPLGSTLPTPGSELWGFIPKEHFIKLNRLRSNSPQLNLPSTPPGISPLPQTKNYFIDGATGVYQLLDVQGTTLTAYIYLSMRRGGRMIYALDVTDPQAPRFLWKVDNATANMSELGQTWSAPRVAKVKGHTNPVLIFGAGYDTNQDVDPPTSNDTMGRGIFVLDAITGSVVWRAIYGANSGSNTGTTFTTSGTPPTALSDRMYYSIPADITLMDRNNDGYIDRLYAADTGGRVWRVDTEPGGNTSPSSWKLHRLATLGDCYSGGSVCRKFFYPPEVINTSSYDAVIVGSGDREHPLYNNTAATGKQNMVFLLKDTYTGNDATGMTRIRHSNDETDLCNATSVTSAQCNTCLANNRGYYINLQDGEKVVNAPLVTAGYVYFSTNKPVAPSVTSCVANLGEARGYRLSPFTCEYSSVEFAGGGLPPSPVSGVVNIEQADGTVIQAPFLIGGANPDCTGADCSSALGGQKPVINVSTTRTRTYWYKEGK